ncbi:protein Wnt-7b [Ctenocephalides felis]|uniref:protein Wnt-7b n=1 Tax=Ctenocephalides felis TaxID=7515 RepID=UPI000E6E3501|nr:protein Wnt-7b [Ctenocephalides felis]
MRTPEQSAKLISELIEECIPENTLKSVSSSLEAQVICARIPGLEARQREICRQSPDALVAVGEGTALGAAECQHQFRHRRWNCTSLGDDNVFGHLMLPGSREAAFMYAVTSAAVAYAVTAACARGNISACGCDTYKQSAFRTVSSWKWSGCGADVGFGIRFARKFLDAREIEQDARSMMNLHNNKAGRKAVKDNLRTECKCHGVSGSCTMKTCWRSLPTFRNVGNYLMKKYYRARLVVAIYGIKQQTRISNLFNKDDGLSLIIKRAKSNGLVGKQIFPKINDFVYLQASPNYCEADLTTGSLGTRGRTCNRTGTGSDGCDIMCCGRGYNTHQNIRSWQCECEFHWCCYVNCRTCTEVKNKYTCK